MEAGIRIVYFIVSALVSSCLVLGALRSVGIGIAGGWYLCKTRRGAHFRVLLRICVGMLNSSSPSHKSKNMACNDLYGVFCCCLSYRRLEAVHPETRDVFR